MMTNKFHTLPLILKLVDIKKNKLLKLAAFLVIIFPAILVAQVASANPRKVSVGAGVTNDTGVSKTDFHVKISGSSIKEVTLARIVTQQGNRIRGTISEIVDGMFTVDWNINTEPGETFDWVVDFTEHEDNNFRVIESFLTPRQSPTDVPIPGWRVEGDGDVFLTNGFTSGISFNNLLFQFPTNLTSDTIFDLLDSPPTGLPGFIDSGIIPAGLLGNPGELLVAKFPSLNPGDFLTARLDTGFTNSEFSALTAKVALGHEHQQVPEPTSNLSFLAIGTLGAASTLKRKQEKNSDE